MKEEVDGVAVEDVGVVEAPLFWSEVSIMSSTFKGLLFWGWRDAEDCLELPEAAERSLLWSFVGFDEDLDDL